MSITEYLIKKKGFVYALVSVGHVFSVEDHVDVIFEGLSTDYDAFVTLINSRPDVYIIEEIESLLMAQEARIEKNVKEQDSAPNEANLATNLVASSNSSNGRHQRGYGFSNNGNHQNSHFFGGRRGQFGAYRGAF